MASRPSRSKSAVVCYRIGDARFPIFCGTGAALIGGRWNPIGVPVIYAAACHSGSLLERLVHANTGRIPGEQALVRIEIPARIRIEQVDTSVLGDHWHLQDQESTQRLGGEWLDRRSSAVLFVPSAVARYDANVLINPLHPDAQRLKVSQPEPVIWHKRLFAQVRAH